MWTPVSYHTSAQIPLRRQLPRALSRCISCAYGYIQAASFPRARRSFKVPYAPSLSAAAAARSRRGSRCNQHQTGSAGCLLVSPTGIGVSDGPLLICPLLLLRRFIDVRIGLGTSCSSFSRLSFLMPFFALVGFPRLLPLVKRYRIEEVPRSDSSGSEQRGALPCRGREGWTRRLPRSSAITRPQLPAPRRCLRRQRRRSSETSFSF